MNNNIINLTNNNSSESGQLLKSWMNESNDFDSSCSGTIMQESITCDLLGGKETFIANVKIPVKDIVPAGK